MQQRIHIFKITAKIQNELHDILLQFQNEIISHGGNILSHSLSSMMRSVSCIAVVQLPHIAIMDTIKVRIGSKAHIHAIDAFYDL